MNATLQDPDLENQIANLSGYLKGLSVQFPIDMDTNEWLNQDFVINCPTFEFESDPVEYLGNTNKNPDEADDDDGQEMNEADLDSINAK